MLLSKASLTERNRGNGDRVEEGEAATAVCQRKYHVPSCESAIAQWLAATSCANEVVSDGKPSLRCIH